MNPHETHQDWYSQRRALVDEMRQREPKLDERVLTAFSCVDRHEFIPAAEQANAYRDRALPLGLDQTISQPSMIAIMLSELDPKPEDRALEIGAGSGYAAALLAQLVRHVDAVEVIPTLAERARDTLARLTTGNVTVHISDGWRGLPELAPFPRIVVSAGASRVPQALVEQLSPGGRIVVPVDEGAYGQVLQIGDKRADGTMAWRSSVGCMFVPLVSAPPRPNPRFES